MLSRRMLLTSVLAASSSAAFAQTAPRPPSTAASATQEVLALREAIRAAIAKKDKAALEALYADNFMHLRDSGRADLKGERIALLLSGEETIETAPENGVAVQVYGTSTAVATGASPIKDAGTGRSAMFRWLAVYVRAEDRWQVALSQASRVPAPARR
jgi:ketosteroid isomerase-like protein